MTRNVARIPEPVIYSTLTDDGYLVYCMECFVTNAKVSDEK